MALTTLSELLETMIRHRALRGGSALDEKSRRGLVEAAMEALEWRGADGFPMSEAVPQQMYEDVFTRVITLLAGSQAAGSGPHLYRCFNALSHRLGLVLAQSVPQGRPSPDRFGDVVRWIRTAVLSGWVGINLKSTSSAASTLLNRDRLPIPPHWTAGMGAVQSVPLEDLREVSRGLVALADAPEGRFHLECLESYRKEVAESKTPVLLVFFCDDYLESMIDLKRFEAMLNHNPRLRVLFIPRAGRYGNDLAHADVKPILEEKPFRSIQPLLDAGRLVISGSGPRAGCLNPVDVCRNLIQEVHRLGVDRRVVIETKGCRNFEMLRGPLPVPWYASFNCNRALSIRTVAVDGAPVFLRIPPGLRAYDGFDRPRLGPGASWNGAPVRFCRMTTLDLFGALDHPVYKDLIQRSGDEGSLHFSLTDFGDQVGMTLAEVVAASAEIKN